MESPQLAPPANATGLPPGVEVGGLGKRFLAHVIDKLIPALLGLAVIYLAPRFADDVGRIIQIAAAALTVGWGLFVWWGFAVRAAGPGMRLMNLQLVGFYDGRPIGWMRFLLRAIVLFALSATGIGLLLMLIFLLMHPRKQGWHDLLVHSVVIRQRALAPPKSKAVTEQRRPPQAISAQQHDQLAGGASPYDGPPYPTPQSLAPPAGVPDSYSSAAAGSPPVPSPDPYRRPGDAGGQLPPPQPLTPPAGVPMPSGAGAAGAGAPPSEAATATQVRPVAVPGADRSNGQVGWLAVLDDGREIEVNGLVLLGRNPQPQPGEEDAQLIKIADETRTVSKSHLAIATDSDGAFVVDRGSTNGSTVTTSAGVSTRCQIGERVRVAEGSIVSIGDHWLEIRRRS